MTDYSKASEPVSEILAQAEQLMKLREIWGCGSDGVSYTRWELHQDDMAAVRRLLSEARVRVAAAEQDTRPLARMVESWDGIAKAIREDARRTEFDERFRLETQARQLEACALELGAALSGLDRETPK